MSLKRSSLAALALAFFVAVTVFVMKAPKLSEAAVTPTRAMITATPVTKPVPAASLTAANPTLSAQARPWLETLKKFNAARSYRAFLYDMDRNRSEGALQYAMEVINICVNSLLGVQEASLTGAGQRDALARLRSRCDMSQAELETELTVMASKMDRMDPASTRLLMAGSGFDHATTAAEEHHAVGAVLATQDPTVMLRLAQAPTGQQGNMRYFLGSEHASGSGSILEFAFRLAQCELGLDCGADSPLTLMLCVRSNWCAPSYRDALHLGLAHEPNRYAQIDTLAAQLVQQMRSQNSAAFVREK